MLYVSVFMKFALCGVTETDIATRIAKASGGKIELASQTKISGGVLSDLVLRNLADSLGGEAAVTQNQPWVIVTDEKGTFVPAPAALYTGGGNCPSDGDLAQVLATALGIPLDQAAVAIKGGGGWMKYAAYALGGVALIWLLSRKM